VSAPTASNTSNTEHTATAIFNVLGETIYFAISISSIIILAAIARAAPNIVDDLVRMICHGSIPQNQPSLSVAVIEVISTVSIWILILKLLLKRLAQVGAAAKDTWDSFQWMLPRSWTRVPISIDASPLPLRAQEIDARRTAVWNNVTEFPHRATQPNVKAAR
jgi:hypothetical protein